VIPSRAGASHWDRRIQAIARTSPATLLLAKPPAPANGLVAQHGNVHRGTAEGDGAERKHDRPDFSEAAILSAARTHRAATERPVGTARRGCRTDLG
jgi:hypothetical protein